MYHPDFEGVCRLCGTSPTVVVEGHTLPDTDLCGVCFFHDRVMIDWQLWRQDGTQREDEEVLV
jgi:hypothetical protein